ncbi:hypothetical protein DENSPDRAFT_862642 [Dentipellis sp. KUC8613]|nr:hypothetical protein DENSPDRAFT_862642 [Dentipellis sp. KUC8613]
MPTPDGVEIIDLTRSSPTPGADAKEPGEISSRAASKGADPERSTRRGRRKRKTSGKDALGGETPGGSTTTSRAQSVQRDAAGPSTEKSSVPAAPEGEETTRKKRKRTRSKHASSLSSRNKEVDELVDESSSLFVIDTAPIQVPANYTFRDAAAGPSKPASTVTEEKADAAATSALLLPAHVSVLDAPDGVPIEIIQAPEPDSESESYIEYLDYDDRTAPGMVRYFAEPSADAKQSKFVCKNCGAENEHKTYECPVLICLTCGARDEHSTRSCPVSKTCFSCGMRGHINKNCPNRYSARANNYDDCDRCGSSTHNTKECPTIWRLYEYLTDNERSNALDTRDEKVTLKFGEGGEGYIARDEWCYNCGGSGHLGDDCGIIPHPYDFPREPSAFSLYNTMSGPFFDPAADPSQASAQTQRRQPRDWEQGAAGGTIGDGWGFDAPVNVGKQGRRKGRERLERRARELEDAEDDAEDWFGNARNVRNRGDAPRSNGGGGKRISFGESVKGGGRFEDINARMGPRHPAEGLLDRPRSYGGDSRKGPPGLLERMSDSRDGERRRSSRDERRDRERSGRDSKRDRERSSRDDRRERERERSGRGDPDRDDWRKREDRGPRYKGGYSR